MMKISIIMLTVVIGLFSIACTKEGPAGADGSNGKDGTTGATGATGATGTANVIYSSWKYATNFNDTTIDNTTLKVGYVNAPDITSTRLNDASILIFLTWGGGYFPLPYTSYAGGKTSTINYQPKLGKIAVMRFTYDNSNSVTLSTFLQYRYIIIPGGIKATKSAETNNDYRAVCAKYGIPE